MRTDLRFCEFIDWMARAQETGLRMARMPEIVLRRRIHDSNTGIRERGSRREYAVVAKAALDRRRRDGLTGRTL